MNIETKKLLTRWQSLEMGDGFRRVDSIARVLWLIGLVLFVFVVFGIVYRLHPAAVAGAAAVMGGWSLRGMRYGRDWCNGPCLSDTLTGSSLKRI